MSQCKYGDPYCPCQDGDACHYEPSQGTPAMAVPPEYVRRALSRVREITEAEAEVVEAAMEYALWKEACNYGPGQAQLIKAEKALIERCGDLANESDGKWVRP